MRWPTPGAANSKLAAMARDMSLVKLAPLGFAIFALFGMLGPAIDIASGGHLRMPLLIRYTVLSGLVAVGYALGVLRQNWGLVEPVRARRTSHLRVYR